MQGHALAVSGVIVNKQSHLHLPQATSTIYLALDGVKLK